MQLTTTKERVLEAVEKDPQAKETLKKLFPDVFGSKYFDLTENEYQHSESYTRLFKCGDVYILIADGLAPDGMRKKCFFLNSAVNWHIEEVEGKTYLIPTRIDKP